MLLNLKANLENNFSYNKIKLIIEDDRNITSKYNEILKNYSWDKIRSFMEGIYNKK